MKKKIFILVKLLFLWSITKGMINTNKVYLSVSKENVSKFITDEQIFRRYTSYEFEINEVFSAPYRRDTHKSFGIYYNRFFNKLMYKDLSLKEGGDCFKYVCKVYNCNLWECLIMINKDFNLNLGGIHLNMNDLKKKNIDYSIHKQTKDIKVIKQNFTEIDKNYWSQYFISSKTLKFYNVDSCKYFYVNNEFKRAYSDKYPIYSYYFPKTNHYKIYIPNESKEFKWYTNASNYKDIMGYDQLPAKGELVYITKSMKDCMVLYELGYNAIATHGEGHYFNPDFIRHIKGRFKKLILFYDNDEAGVLCSENIAQMYDLENFRLSSKEKDISDFIKNYGKQEGKRVIQY